jgi:dephospho-CoA kinase
MIIGITGGIAMGKTAVSNHLELHYGFKVLDADFYAREAVAIGSPILEQITHRYGSKILLTDGQLDRPALGRIIFTDRSERQWLEAQIHPEVRRLIQAETDRLLQDQKNTTSTQPIFWVIPLLFETGMAELLDRIWVIYCHPEQQLQRLCDRSGLTRDEAKSRIATQWDIQLKCDRADVVLDNSGSLEDLYQQISQVLKPQA